MSRLHDDEPTLSAPIDAASSALPDGIGLTVLWHPEPSRIGEQAWLPDTGANLSLSRFEPLFRRRGERQGQALAHRGVSRSPLRLSVLDDARVKLEPPQSRMSLALDGVPVTTECVIEAERIERGALLSLGDRILLCVHPVDRSGVAVGLGGLVGCGRAMLRIQNELRRAARSDAPVLLHGETGTGKELAAQAIHALSARAAAPLVATNMAALGESLAAVELFGAERGAYTGAATARHGLFAEAEGGSLFLDEIGDTAAAVQPMLLRVLESGEYRSVGGQRTRRADVRLIAATDRDLGARGFNQPLRRRLETLVVQLPPLRHRREDTGLLLRHFLQQQGLDDARLAALPLDLVQALCRYDWPGNVRQLRSVAIRLALALEAGEMPTAADLLREAGAMDAAPITAAGGVPSSPSPYRRPSSVSGEEVLQALERNDWCVRQAAASLGVARASFYALIDAHPQVRDARQIPLEEIAAAVRESPHQPERWAARLRTPREALRRRVRELGLESG